MLIVQEPSRHRAGLSKGNQPVYMLGLYNIIVMFNKYMVTGKSDQKTRLHGVHLQDYEMPGFKYYLRSKPNIGLQHGTSSLRTIDRPRSVK